MQPIFKHLLHLVHTVSIALLCTSSALSQNASPGLQAVRSIEGVHEYVLPNGLQVLLVPDAAKPVATVNITYRVGSRHESLGETGSAHLLEHMLFKASGKVDNPIRDMTALGMRWNGTTWLDRTNYFAHFLANDEKAAERMDYMLDWLSGMMTQAKFTRADLDSEMTVVRNEFERAENEPGRVLGDRIRAAAYSVHGYGHSTLGARSDIENMPLETLYAFYRKHYRPDNATLIIAGRFDEAQVKAKISAAFSAIAKPAAPLPATYSLEPAQDGERSVTLRRVGGLASTAVLYHMPAGNTREGVAAKVLAETLQQREGPLARALVNTQLAVTGWAFVPATREPGYLMAGVGLPEKTSGSTDEQFAIVALGSAAALAKVMEVYQPTDTEVNSARNALLAGYRAVLRDAEATGQTLSEMVALGDWRLLFALRDNIDTITGDEVRKLAKAYLVASNRTAGTFLPISGASAKTQARAPQSHIPDATQFIAARAISTVVSAINSVKNEASEDKIDDFELSAAALKERTQRGQLTVGATPGIKLAVLPRAAKDNRVLASLRLRWGNADSLKGSNVLATMIGPLLVEGTPSMNALQIKERLQTLDARISFGSSAGFLNASLEFPAANTQAVLALLDQLLRTSDFNTAAFERNQRAMLASMQSIVANPNSVAGNLLERSYRPKNRYPEGDPREVRTHAETENQMRSASASDLRAHWKKFANAQVGELVLLGPVQLTTVQTQLQSLWGNWTSAERFVPWQSAHYQPTGIGETSDRHALIRMADKANASYTSRIAFALNEADDDYPALFVATQLLNRQGLWERVREKEGLSYGVGASLSAPTVGNAAAININASFAPQNREKLQRVIREVLEEKREKGFSSLEVGFAKSAIISRRTEWLAQPGNALGNIAFNLRFNKPLDHYAALTPLFEKLDTVAVNAALKKYLEVANLREVLAGSFE